MSKIRKVARAVAAAKSSSNMEEFRSFIEEYRRLLIENLDTTTTSEFETGHLSNNIQYYISTPWTSIFTCPFCKYNYVEK